MPQLPVPPPPSPPCKRAISSLQPEDRAHVARALRNLAVSEEQRVNVADAGAIPVLIELLQTGRESTVSTTTKQVLPIWWRGLLTSIGGRSADDCRRDPAWRCCRDRPESHQ